MQARFWNLSRFARQCEGECDVVSRITVTYTAVTDVDEC